MSTKLLRWFAALCTLTIAFWGPACARINPTELSAEEARLEQLFKKLHRRLYKVYSLDPIESLGLDRNAIHDLLAASFSGEALTDEYVEHFVTLTQMREEGTAIDVVRVDYERVDVLERDEYIVVLDADWSVAGIVTHQGHKHARVNRYRAIYTLASSKPLDEAGLRIVDTRMQSLERVGNLPGGTGFPLDELPTSTRGFMTAEELIRGGLFAESDSAETGDDDER